MSVWHLGIALMNIHEFLLWFVRRNSNDYSQGNLCIHVCRVPVRVSHVASGESSKELAKPNLWILAILAKSINSSN